MPRSAAYDVLLNKLLIQSLTLCTLLTTLFASALLQAEQARTQPRMVLIIDDIGNNRENGTRAIQLPGAITYGILPHAPLAKKFAWYASQQTDGKEVIIHMPMQPRGNEKLEPGTLLVDHSREHFLAALDNAFRAVPHARGLSNHMGSAMTAQAEPMRWLMAELEQRQLYFVDSKTTTHSEAASAAASSALPFLSRDIFLDHDPRPAAIAAAFERAIALARREGLAVVIGHPYPSTLSYLEQALPALAEAGVALVAASEALKSPSTTTIAAGQRPLASPQQSL